MRKIGVVKSDGENAEVAIVRQSSCGENCATCKGECKTEETFIAAYNEAGAKTGDRVYVEIADKDAVTAAFLAYIVPIVILLLASGTVAYLGYGDGVAALCGLGAMAFGIMTMKQVTAIKKDKFKVKIVEIIK